MIRLFRSIEDIPAPRPGRGAVVAFGSFDGLHRGHRALIARVRREARRREGQAFVLSFTNHPLSVLAPPYCPKLLLSLERKVEILAQLGVDAVALPEFTPALGRIPARRFIRDVLIRRIGMRHIVCGYDCRFGRDGRGDGELLRAESRSLNYGVEVLPPLEHDGAPVSSGLARELLDLGEVGRAVTLLERPHELTGQVVTGDGRGRQLGFPTANLQFPESLLVPAHGVYAVWADVDSRRYGGMINLGVRPTFEGPAFSAEVHLFNFDRSIYGKSVTVYFLRRLRDEKRFAGPAALVRQLKADRAAAVRALQTFG
jgi:riboflavin kinase/FMN adenylyltransferase